MNKIFMTLYRQIDKNNYVKSLEEYLCKLEFSLKFPKDEEFISKFKEKNIYESIAQKKKMYLFNKLEQGLGKEVVDFNKTDLTIEHIFPQNPDGAWEEDLTEEEYSIAEKNLHKIANLTLSANNGALGNKIFIEKKNMNIDNGQQGYIYSSLWLNEYLKQIEEWKPKNIEERFEKIKERFLQVWRYPI